jgi:hypothetical protein
LKPRIPLSFDRMTSLGVPDESSLVPALQKARDDFGNTVYPLRGFDIITVEVVRLRNARVQSCHL